jgi:hypothetical protein
MNSENLSTARRSYDSEERQASTARFVDEKISDDSGTEAKADKPLAPAGLKNPFWK